MKCPNCNANNEEKTVFCKTCGQRLNGEASDLNNLRKTKKQDTKNSAEKIMNDKANVEEGCVSSAWYDIRKSSSWIKKILIVGICNIVPILNFASTGYAQKWGAEIAIGKREKLKFGIFENDSFKTGFFEWLTWIVYGFVFGLASIIINSVFSKFLLIGSIIWVALLIAGIFWNAYVSLACMKTAMDDKLSSSFELKKLWAAYKNQPGKIFASYFIPSLICKLISTGFCLLIFVIFAAKQIAQIFNLITNIQYLLTSSTAITYAFSLFSSLFLCVLFCYIGYAFMNGVEKVFRYRSIGHFINKHVQGQTW